MVRVSVAVCPGMSCELVGVGMRFVAGVPLFWATLGELTGPGVGLLAVAPEF